ncbi:MAG: single-stranded DNA-binding protein [Chloroflexi bacterium]|nr:single-stranded DNA-binding protein [Chloroflexota bacterium]
MVGLNKIMVIGNVGTDPEMRYTPNGNPVTSFRIAASRAYTTADGERHQETEWFTVVAWRQLAEQCNQYLAKGRKAYVEGRLHSRSWEGQDGKTRFVNEITADRVLFLDRGPGYQAGEGAGESGPSGADNPGASVDAEDLPF